VFLTIDLYFMNSLIFPHANCNRTQSLKLLHILLHSIYSALQTCLIASRPYTALHFPVLISHMDSCKLTWQIALLFPNHHGFLLFLQPLVCSSHKFIQHWEEKEKVIVLTFFLLHKLVSFPESETAALFCATSS